jgi:DNA-binding MarR family transcriptional regulator
MGSATKFETDCDDIAARCALYTARRLARALSRHFDSHLAPSGLRGTQYNVLVAIARSRGADMTSLGRRLGLDRTALTHALRALVRDGLVESVAGTDRRRRELRLTRLGRRRVAAAVPLWSAAQCRVERHLRETPWAELAVSLRRLSRRIESAEGDGLPRNRAGG